MSEDNFTTLYPQRWVPIGLSSNPFTKWLRTCKRQQVATDMQHQVTKATNLTKQTSAMLNFNLASVTTEVQKFDPRKSPKEAPKPTFWTRNQGLAGVRCLQTKLERHLQIRQSASDKNMHAHQFTHRERQKEMSTRTETTQTSASSGCPQHFSDHEMSLQIDGYTDYWVDSLVLFCPHALDSASGVTGMGGPAKVFHHVFERGGGMIARALSSEGWSSNFLPGSNRLES